MSFDVHIEWGEEGLNAWGSLAGTIVIVDVLRFSTAVVAGVGAGAFVEPVARERELSAGVVGLVPEDLSSVAPGTHVVMPSANGSHLSTVAAECGARVLAGALTNATAAGRVAADEPPVLIVAAGERWNITHGLLRPALEDYLGAAAVAAACDGLSLSTETSVAVAAFRSVQERLASVIANCQSGHELTAKGRERDVQWAAQLDSTSVVPVLTDGRFTSG